jgi:hypothetical protein
MRLILARPRLRLAPVKSRRSSFRYEVVMRSRYRYIVFHGSGSSLVKYTGSGSYYDHFPTVPIRYTCTWYFLKRQTFFIEFITGNYHCHVILITGYRYIRTPVITLKVELMYELLI